MLKVLTGVFGTRHDRERKRIQPIVDTINVEYERLQSVSEEELRSQTERFRERIREATGALEARVAELKEQKHDTADSAERERIDLELSGADGRGGVEGELRETTAEILDEILPEAFATVREAARRLLGTTVRVTGHDQIWNMVHYDVQLMGGIQLHMGRIAEMATGEGKTLVATLPLYLNSLPGKGAHLITVNSYLARRDSEWMGHVYKYLGLTVGCIDDTEPGTPERRAAYECDVTYGTNNEFGFDYLRDNMVVSNDQRVQRNHVRSEEHTSELQSPCNLVCRLLLEKKNYNHFTYRKRRNRIPFFWTTNRYFSDTNTFFINTFLQHFYLILLSCFPQFHLFTNFLLCL